MNPLLKSYFEKLKNVNAKERFKGEQKVFIREFIKDRELCFHIIENEKD